MLSVVRNNYGSASPLITVVILIIVLGLCFGVAGVILDAVGHSTVLFIDWTIWNLWLALPIVALFIIASWAFVKAQRGKGVF